MLGAPKAFGTVAMANNVSGVGNLRAIFIWKITANLKPCDDRSDHQLSNLFTLIAFFDPFAMLFKLLLQFTFPTHNVCLMVSESPKYYLLFILCFFMPRWLNPFLL